jgi:HSP20 family protein
MSRNLFEQWNQIQRKLAGLSDADHEAHTSTTWSPNTDMYDGPNGLVVKMELAGVACSEIDIQLTDRALVIRGMRRDPYSGETGAGYRFRQMEIEYGAFQRVIAVPYPVDGARARAACAGGFLEIHLPRAQKQAHRRITIVMET